MIWNGFSVDVSIDRESAIVCCDSCFDLIDISTLDLDSYCAIDFERVCGTVEVSMNSAWDSRYSNLKVFAVAVAVARKRMSDDLSGKSPEWASALEWRKSSLRRRFSSSSIDSDDFCCRSN